MTGPPRCLADRRRRPSGTRRRSAASPARPGPDERAPRAAALAAVGSQPEMVAANAYAITSPAVAHRGRREPALASLHESTHLDAVCDAVAHRMLRADPRPRPQQRVQHRTLARVSASLSLGWRRLRAQRKGEGAPQALICDGGAAEAVNRRDRARRSSTGPPGSARGA